MATTARDRKPVDPFLRDFLDHQAGPKLTDLPESERVEAARNRLLNALSSRDTIPGLPTDVRVRDLEIAPGLTARLYTPPHLPAPLPTLIYLHGGGWVAGTLDTHDPFCRLLSHAAGLLIVSVDYRRAPEHPYPAALEDTLTAVHWAAEHIQEHSGDPTHLGLGGDSAGGNLAAVAANRLASTPAAPTLRALVLLYPVTDHPSANHRSYEENATGFSLEAEGMRWYWRQYAPNASPDDPDLSPLRNPHLPPTLPPTLVTTAEYDVLRDEGTAYAGKLRTAGIAVTHLHAPDMHHDFPVSPATVARFPQSQTAINVIAGWLRAMLAPQTLRTTSRYRNDAD